MHLLTIEGEEAGFRPVIDQVTRPWLLAEHQGKLASIQPRGSLPVVALGFPDEECAASYLDAAQRIFWRWFG